MHMLRLCMIYDGLVTLVLPHKEITLLFFREVVQFYDKFNAEKLQF